MTQDRQTGLLDRRKWLKALGGVLALPPVLAPLDAGITKKAKKNVKLAIMGHIYSGFPIEEAAQKIRADGFHGVILEFKFADVRFDPMDPNWEAARRITECFGRHGIKIIGLSAYYNVVDPDVARRERGERLMQLMIANWKRLGSPVICTATGSRNAKSQWVESPENTTEEAYLLCRSNLAKMTRAAERTGAVIAIEPYWRNIIDSAERAERLFHDLNSPSLKLAMDPANYYRKSDIPRMQPMLEDIFRRVGRHTVLAHAKDLKASDTGTDLPAPGLGVLDYPLYLRLLAQLDREIYLAIEHLTLEDVPRARDYVVSQFERI